MMIEVVPFRHVEWDHGLQHRVSHDGLISLEAATVIVEVRSRRQDFTYTSRTEIVTRSWQLPLEMIDGVLLRRRLFGGVSVRLRSRSLTLLDGLPCCAGREFRAPVGRGDRDAARAFAAHLNDRLADRMLSRLDDGGAGGLLP